MGAGKTTIGRQLAKRLQCSFYDSDKEIEKRTGASVSLIFELEQEDGFRKRERTVIDELTQRQNIILATGGGAVLSDENRIHLTSRGYVIYLSASVDQLLQRTSQDKNRPLLKTKNPREKLIELIEKRDPLYRQVANLIVKTDNQSVKAVVFKITDHVKNLNLRTNQ